MATSSSRRPAVAAASATDDAGKLLLRVLIGLLVLFHGVAKLMNGLGPVLGAVEKAGLPPSVAYLAYVGEVLAPLLLVIGAWTRPAALIVAINMVFALVLVHKAQFLSINPQSGGWAIELPETCPAPYPAADQLVSWNIDATDGSVLLLNGDNQVVMRLEPE